MALYKRYGKIAIKFNLKKINLNNQKSSTLFRSHYYKYVLDAACTEGSPNNSYSR